MKYDCNKTLDYVHEFMRMCDTENPTGNLQDCMACPFKINVSDSCDGVTDITQEMIDALQIWSDEHPEKPKITIEEWDFLESFKDKSLLIARYGSGLRLMHGGSWIDLRGMMFSFIHINRPWTIGELLELEVKDE